jgi:hypothetical protein
VKRIGIMLLTILIIIFSFNLYGQTLPVFKPGKYIQANGSNLHPDIADAAPCIADWNGDGLKDLLIGEQYYAKIRLYLNSGTNAAPVFTSFSYIKADGTHIQVSYG